ncbi:MAG: hypothetical protein ACLR06_05260 [Christensenellaceae bacterium]
MRYGDLHSDTLTAARGAEQFLHMKNAQISLEKLIGEIAFYNVLPCFPAPPRRTRGGALCPFFPPFARRRGN